MILTPELEIGLRAVSARCFGRAAESLGVLLGRPVRIAVTSVDCLPPEAVAGLVNLQDGRRLVALQFEFSGEESGFLLIVIPLGAVRQLLRCLIMRQVAPNPEEFSALETSAVREAGNILASAFVAELGDLVRRRILPSSPRLKFEGIDELVRDLSRTLRRIGPEVVVIRAHFDDPEGDIEGHFLVFPELDSLDRLQSAGER